MTRNSSQPKIISGPVSILDWRARAWGALLLLIAVAVGGFAGYQLGLNRADLGRERRAALAAELEQARDRIELLSRRNAVAERGAGVTEKANEALRDQVAEQEQLIAKLRADVEFYQRLLGTGGSRDGLAVHALQLQPTVSARVFRFQLTLSQNLKRARVISGRARFSLEGIRNDSPEELDMDALGVDAEELAYEFKYFQQLEGSLTLPSDFRPERIRVELVPEGRGARERVERAFDWDEVQLGSAVTGDDETGSAD